MSAPVRVGPSPSGGGPVPALDLPTLEQLLILVARAERKGGLDHAEGSRLRQGLCYLAEQNHGGVVQDPAVVALRRKYETVRKKAWIWKRRAEAASGNSHPDEAAREAVQRVVALATRWTHIPAKRQAGASVLAAVSNRDVDAA